MNKKKIILLGTIVLAVGTIIILNFKSAQSAQKDLKDSSYASGRTASFTIFNIVSCEKSECVVEKVIQGLNALGLVVLIIMLLWAAIMMATALPAGDEKRITQAKEIIIYAVLGYAVLLISGGVVKIVTDILTP